MKKSRLLPRFAQALLALFAATPLLAATHVWTGDASNRFSDAANWRGGSPEGDPEAELVFPDAVRQSLVNDLAALTVRSMTFETNGYELRGNAIDLLEGAELEVRENTITCALRFDGNVMDEPVRGHVRFARNATAIAPVSQPRSDAQSTIFKFTSNSILLNVTPSAEIVWTALLPRPAYFQVLEGRSGDTNDDGVVELPMSSAYLTVSTGSWCVVDVAARKVHAARANGEAQEVLPLSARFLRDASGAYSAADVNVGIVRGELRVLWVRPGVGAWTGYAKTVVSIDGQDHVLAERTLLFPVEGSPDQPAGFARGDILAATSLDQNGAANITGGLVDAALAATASNPAVVGLAGYNTREGSPTARFDLVRYGSTESDITVSYRIIGETAVAGVQFEATSGTVTVARGEIRKSVPLPLINDDVYSGTTTIRVELTGATGATLASPASRVVSITDDDPLPGLNVPAVTVVEGGDGLHTAAVKLILTGKTRLPSVVTWRSYGAGAPSTEWQQLTFAVGETEKTILVPYNGNTVAEPDRTITIDFKQDALSVNSRAQVSIKDDDAMGVSGQKVEVTEGATSATVKVTLDAPLTETVVLRYVIKRPVGSTGGVEGATGTLTFAAGETEKGVVIALEQDTIPEDDEKIIVELTPVTPATMLVHRHGELLVHDDGDRVTAVTIVRDANTPADTDIFFSVKATPGLAKWSYFVGARLIAGTATPGVDYVPFPLGYDSVRGMQIGAIANYIGRVSVGLLADPEIDPDETVYLEIYDLENPARLLGRYTVIIHDDQSAFPKLSVSNATVREGGTASFQVSLPAPAKQQTSFRVTTVGDTAESGVDFTPVSNVYTILYGQQSVKVEVKTIDDQLIEHDERFSIRLSEVYNAQGNDATGWATITDDDSPPPPVPSIANISVKESEATARFTVQLAAPAAQRVTFPYQTIDATAIAGSDYTAAQGTLIFETGQTTKTIDVAILNDSVNETAETFKLRVGTAVDAVCTISDDDAPVTPVFSVANVAVRESDASARFTVQLAAALPQRMTVAYETIDGSASSGEDYTARQGTLVFEAGETAKMIDVAILNDDRHESDETFTFRVGGTSVAACTITDDDAAPPVELPKLRISDTSAREGAMASFQVSLSPASTQAVSFRVTTVGDTAEAGLDFTTLANVYTIQPGAQRLTVNVQTLDDTFVEGDETFSVRLSQVTNATADDAIGRATIIDDDGRPPGTHIDVSDPNPFVEGNLGQLGQVTFGLTLSSPGTVPMTISYA
ncbi:MAG: hypothetical protein M3Q69_11950, partial [Acidobacteriota bacterium]|nr:hypothetical protein [Acidobacteriota bacterium]